MNCNTFIHRKVSSCKLLLARRYWQLQPEDRVTMARLLQLNYSLREIATVLKLSPSTISRGQRRIL